MEICQRNDCYNEIEQHTRKGGRQRKYCSDACRQKALRDRRGQSDRRKKDVYKVYRSTVERHIREAIEQGLTGEQALRKLANTLLMDIE